MWKLKVKEGLVNVKDENNMEIFDIEIINNRKIEKNKLFLLGRVWKLKINNIFNDYQIIYPYTTNAWKR